jgi:hypothetical protein
MKEERLKAAPAAIAFFAKDLREVGIPVNFVQRKAS